MRSILSKFDEYQSAENAKHVRRSMLANAKQGFWNGSRPPLGYSVVVAERRGDKDKKVLVIDETEAPLVRRRLDHQTGKSGQHRYYACSRRATRGETACTGRLIRMEKLDRSVLDELENRIVAPERLPDLLAAFLEKTDESDNRRREELTLLRSAKTNSTGALNRLFELVERGLAAPSDRDFAERLTYHRQRIAALTSDITALQKQLTSSQRRITPDVVEKFGSLLREGLRGDNPALRQAYVRLLIDEVIVGAEQVHIRGSRKALESAVLATSGRPGAGVPSFAREWRTRQDSNL